MKIKHTHLGIMAGLLALSTFTFAPAVQAQQPDQAQLLQMLLGQRAQGGSSQAQQPTQAALPAMSEVQLAATLAAWAPGQGPYETESFRDGFSIAGEHVLDPEGMIMKYAVDRSNGDAAYLAEVGPNQYVIKLMRYGVGAPLTLATASRQFGVWTVQTATGVKVAGSTMTLSPRGFGVARQNSMFLYTAGAGLKSFGLPDNFMMAAHQNGDVLGTKWVLLEKRLETKQAEGGLLAGTSLGQMFGIVKQIGAAVGVTKSEADYALYNLATRKILPIGISLDDKQANFLSQCYQRTRWVAQCDRLDLVDSLYGQDGSPNRQHYFWRLAWYQTSLGPVALVMEDNIGKVDAVSLNDDRRVNVFARALGIAGWSSKQLSDGRIVANAQMGFSRETADDVASLFSKTVATQAIGAPTAAQ